MKLTNAFGSGWLASPSDIATAIAALDPDNNSFTVLESSDQFYIQTAYEDGDFVVEKRDGGPDHHFRAWHMGGTDRFDKAQVQRLFDAYYRTEAFPLTVEWRPYRLDGSMISVGNLFRGFSVWKAAVLMLFVAAAYLGAQMLRGLLQ
jgi:hypothetical protein